MTHPVIEDLNWRYAVKKYDPSKKVSESDLNVIFEAMRLSASSINSQPWKFIVIESENAKKRLDKTFERLYQFNRPFVFDSSHIILFAYNPRYSRVDYAKVIDKAIEDKRIKPEESGKAFVRFAFAEMNTDRDGDSSCWTKAQTYLALGNTLHVLARLKIDSTPLEGIDTELLNEEFKSELSGYRCDVALAIGYRHKNDSNAKLPKSRLSLDDILLRI